MACGAVFLVALGNCTYFGGPGNKSSIPSCLDPAAGKPLASAEMLQLQHSRRVGAAFSSVGIQPRTTHEGHGAFGVYVLVTSMNLDISGGVLHEGC